jgi:hypothetical protein
VAAGIVLDRAFIFSIVDVYRGGWDFASERLTISC